MFVLMTSLYLFVPTTSFAQDDNSNALILTVDEQLWVSQHPIVRVSNQMSWAPIDFVKGGQATGFSIDYINLVLQKVGLRPEYINGYKWDELNKLIVENKIDIIHSLIQTDERDKKFLFTYPYLDVSMGYFAKKNDQVFQPPTNQSGSIIGVIRASGTLAAYKHAYPNANFIEYSNLMEALIALSSENIDFYVGRIPVVNYTINKNFMADLELVGEVALTSSAPSNRLHMATVKGMEQLINILNKGMASITDEEYNKIISKWQAKSLDDRNLALTDEEIVWLERNNTIRVSAVSDLQPLEFIDADGRISGITGSYLNKISEMLNIRFEWAKNNSWAQGFEMIKSGQSDIISAATPTPERSKHLIFSDSYLSLTNMIFTKSEKVTYTTMEDLVGKTMVLVHEFAVTELIEQDYPEINIIKVNSVKEALLTLERGDADAYAGSILVVSPILNEEKIEGIVAAGESPYRIIETIGIRPDLTLLASAINKALNAISIAERTAINQKWMSLKTEPKQDYGLVIIIASVLSSIILIILMWNTRLRREVASRIKIEHELKKARIEAEQANTAKSAFLANMSHEIRTPLNAIIGFSDFITSEIHGQIQPSIYKEYLEDIMNSGRHLVTVIDDILDLSKIEAGKFHLQEKAFDLNECIIDALKMLTVNADNKNIKLEYKENTLQIFGDINAIKRIIINLLSNAVKYTNPDGLISCELLKLENGGITINITDNGIGIPEDKIEQVINPFEQIEHSFDINEEGTGLGLSIVQKLTELHGGRFSLKSTVDIGTTATIELSKSRVLS